MALGNDGVRPNASELRVRFACGFAVGALAGAVSALELGAFSAEATVLAALGSGVLAGLLARHWGDRFWSSLRWWA